MFEISVLNYDMERRNTHFYCSNIPFQIPVMIEFVQNDVEDNDPVIKKRHVLLTLYLALLSFSALFGLVCYSIALFSGEDLVSEVLLIDPPLFLFPVWMTCVQILICIIDLVAFAAIFKWRKWGFWLFFFI